MNTVSRTPHRFSIGAQYIAAAGVWGGSFLLIKISVGGMSPAQVALGRLVGGAVMLAIIMLISRRKWPTGLKTWGHLFAIGILMCVAPFLLFSWAAQYLPSGLSSIYNATTPIATMLIALVVLPEEKLNKLKTTAMLAAAGGIILVVAPWRALADTSSPNFLLAQAACLAATTCYGCGFTYTRRFFRGHDYDSTTVASSQIGAAALVMLALTPFIGLDPVALSPTVIASIFLLGTVSTGIAYIWYTNVINAWGATVASTVTYLTPVGGVILGILVLGEVIHWNEIVGGVVVVLSILISQGRLKLPSRGSSLQRMPSGWPESQNAEKNIEARRRHLPCYQYREDPSW